ncbi:MAG: hypothetical protein IKU55_04210 [Clostridia bacterium]|nr:hypothetical protein [Clostridia bacterium]
MQSRIGKSVLWITRTAMMLAVLVTVQYLTRNFGQIVTGAAVNFVLVATALLCGMSSSVVVALASPFLAKLLGIGPLWELIPVIALGNLAISAIFASILGRARKLVGKEKYSMWLAAIVAGAVAKYFVLNMGIVKIVLPLMTSLPAAQSEKIASMFSTMQLVTALIGGVIAMLAVEPIREALKKSRTN